MREGRSKTLFDLPVSSLWPQGGEFLVLESGRDTDDSIVTSDAIAPDTTKQGGPDGTEARAPRFDCDKGSSAGVNPGKQLADPWILEVVEEEIGDDEIGFLESIEHIAGANLGIPTS